MGAFGAGELIQGSNNAFDGFGRLMVDGAYYEPTTLAYTMADGGQTVITSAGTAAGLTVYRKITVPNSGGEDFARTVDFFTNSTAYDIAATVQIVGNLGSDAATTVFATSTGSAIPTPADQWFGTNGGSGPSIIYYLHGLHGLQPSSVNVLDDNVTWTYNLIVPAGQTKELGYFTIQAADSTQAIGEANAIVGPNGFLDTAATGLNSGDLAGLANFQFNHPPTDISLSNASVAENRPIGTVIGSLSMTDADIGDAHTYTLVSGTGSAGNDSFTTVGNTLKTAAAFDYETKDSYSIRVRTTDQYGLWCDKIFTIAVIDMPEVFSAGPSAWNAAGTTGLTLKLGTDGKLHLYQTGTTIDAVPPHVPSKVTNIQITGRNNADDELTVDFSQGNPLPVTGMVFDGGGDTSGDTFLLKGTPGNDDVTLTTTHVFLAGMPRIRYANIEFFGFDLGGGENSLMINNSTLRINADDAISAGTDVVIYDGTLDLNGKTETLGDLTLVSGSILSGTLHADSYLIEGGTITAKIAGPGELIKTSTEQATVDAVNTSNVTVSDGQLTATSIVTGNLTIGAGVTLTIATIPSGPLSAPDLKTNLIKSLLPSELPPSAGITTLQETAIDTVSPVVSAGAKIVEAQPLAVYAVLAEPIATSNDPAAPTAADSLPNASVNIVDLPTTVISDMQSTVPGKTGPRAAN